MSDTHERLWHEWYAVWHDADASKAKPSYEEWLEARIEELEKRLAKLQPPSTLDRMIDEGYIDDSPSDY